MIIRTAALSAASLAIALSVGCAHDEPQAQSLPTSAQPLEGNPGATTNRASGYDASDPAHYHPQTDDTRQYHPADPAAVQPAH